MLTLRTAPQDERTRFTRAASELAPSGLDLPTLQGGDMNRRFSLAHLALLNEG